MKHLFPVFLFILAIYIYSCANQGTPTGGPKDTIPPTLLESNPNHKTLNFKGTEFKLTFDEKISAEKLKSNLLITPHTESKYSIKVRKNQLTLKFEDPFEDSTTFTLNFADGLVDLTEKNPAINLRIAFSTGPVIDSIYITGKITDLYTNQDEKEFLVALYQLTDSLDIFQDKPRYIAKTNEQGQFLIENIKDSYYKILTFEDNNKNLIFNPQTEKHGFLPDSIDLTQSQDSVRIKTVQINTAPLAFIRSKTTGRYYDAQYKKSIVQYQLDKLDSKNKLEIPPNSLIKDNQIIRFYPNPTYQLEVDSLGLIITASDSLSNESIDTVFIKYIETSRKADKFSRIYTPQNNDYIDPKFIQEISFSKPIVSYHSDSIYFKYDTLKIQRVPDSVFTWNYNHTKLTFENNLDRNFLKSEIDTLIKIYSDTTLTDSISLAKRAYFSKVKTSNVSLKIPHGTFISVEQDTAETINNIYQFQSLDAMGSVSGQISSSYTSFTLQLIDTKFNVIEESTNGPSFDFPYVKPGKYTFRILIDNNNDGNWTYGNLLNNEAPEEIYFYPEIFDVRANWQLENIQITF